MNKLIKSEDFNVLGLNDEKKHESFKNYLQKNQQNHLHFFNEHPNLYNKFSKYINANGKTRSLYHYNEHPFYDEFGGKEVIFTSGELENIPRENSKLSLYCDFQK